MVGFCCIGKKLEELTESDYGKLEYEEGLDNFNRNGDPDAPEITKVNSLL
jgi:hypothetical protein